MVIFLLSMLIMTSCGEHDCEEYYTLVDVEDATCTKEGREVYVCSKCDRKNEITIPMKEHTFVNVYSKSPSCKEEGIIRYECSQCGFSFDETIPKTSHINVEIIVHPAKCTEAGATYYQCSNCQEISSVDIPPLGHLFEEVINIPPTCCSDGYVKYSCLREDCTEGDEQLIPMIDHVPINYATIYEDCTCKECGQVLQRKLDHELAINYYYGYTSDLYSTPIYTQDRTGHDLGKYNFYSTSTPIPGQEIVFNESVSLFDFYSHNLLTSKNVITENGKHFYVDGGFKVSFDFKTISNDRYNAGEMNIQKHSDFMNHFENDSMLMLVKEGKSTDKYYTIYEVVDFAYSTIEVARLVDGKYVTVATVNTPESWNSVWDLENIFLSDSNDQLFSTAGTYRVMFKFSVAWFIESLSGTIYDSSGLVCYPYGILNDQYDYFYVTVTDKTYNVLLPEDIDESRDMFYQINLDDVNNSAPFIKSGYMVDIEDNIDIIFDSKIGYWNGKYHYKGDVLTNWNMSFSLYDSATDTYIVQTDYDLFDNLSEQGSGKIKISKSNTTGDCKIEIRYTLQDSITGEERLYTDTYYLNIS